MPDIRYVILSDLHFGAQNSLLSNVSTETGSGRSTVNPDEASAVMRCMVDCLQDLIVANDDWALPTLVLGGDVLELGQEIHRARDRLHKVEGAVALLLNRDQVRADVSRERNKQQDRWLRTIVALAAIGAIIEPLLTHFISGG